MKKRNLLLIFLLIILISLLPLIMFVTWHLKPKKELKIAVIDKTSFTTDCDEHKSLNWILNNNKYCRPNRDLYSVSEDYYGFFPKENKKYLINDFENFDEVQLKNLANRLDMIYMTDLYGIYSKDWYGNNYRGERSQLIYGGMSGKDLSLLNLMRDQKKLIITEFNTIAPPTSRRVETQFEEMFGLKWSGWTGRYFNVLDTTANKDIPVWVVRDYKDQHNNHWPFKGSGIVLVNNDDRIEILENKKDLKEEVPYIISAEINQKRFGIPKKLKYSYWFDVMLTKRLNNVVSVYQIFSNARGDSILQSLNIPNPFPAVIEHYDKDYKFYYFCGDFCDNPVRMILSKFWGIAKFRWLMYPSNDLAERESFFWLYYQPLVSTILINYYDSLQKK
ncbi:MAG: hypothetical protein NTZ27_10360 [Ignavibacteriales bacterium]|nr:hypothetical protein [Ignavibacteriales bacterium]